MPEILSAPRSSGGPKRGGTVSSAPRSSGGSRPSGGKVTSAPRGIDFGRASAGQAAQFTAAAARDTPDRGPGPAFTPIRVLLDAASAPSYAIGNLAAGRPGEAAKVLGTLGQRGSKTMISDVLKSHGLLPGGAFGTALGLAANIATDPTTYVTFGGASAARAASKSASEHLLSRVASSAAKGERVKIADVATSAAMHEKALADIAPALSIGFRVPFTRAKVVTLAESQAASKAGRKVAHAIGSTRVGESLREVFLPAGAGSKSAHRIGRAAARAGEAEKVVITKQAEEFQRAVAKAAKEAGMSPADAFPALVRSLDQPDKYPVPAALAHLRDDAAKQLDTFRALEDQAGVERGLVPDYVPHLPANAAERRKYERMFPRDPNSRAFFQMERSLPNLDAWAAAGLNPELNLARLLEVRGHASVDARVLKAFDEAVSDIPVTTADAQRVKEMIRPMMTGSYAVEDAKRFVNAVGSSWKSLALLSPGYHLRNLQSDLVSAWWAGARNPASYLQAARLLSGKGGTIKIAGRVFSRDEFVSLAESAGAIRLGFAGKEIRAGLEEAGGAGLRRHGLRPSRPGFGKVARASNTVGQVREDMVRLGTFIERMKAGDDALTAGHVTRLFLYDYGDVGKFVRTARRFWLPFITFPSKAVPMVGRVALTRPGTIATTAKVTRALNEASGDPDLSLLPTGARSSFAVPAPSFVRHLIGAPEGQPLLFNPESVLAYGSLNQLDASNPLRSVGGLLNPIPKAAVEGKTGYSFYFNGPGGKTVKAPAVINALARLGAPIPRYGTKTNAYSGETSPVYSRNLDLFLRMFPPFSQSAALIPGGGSDTTRLPYLRYFAGLSISPYDQAKAAYYADKYGRK